MQASPALGSCPEGTHCTAEVTLSVSANGAAPLGLATAAYGALTTASFQACPLPCKLFGQSYFYVSSMKHETRNRCILIVNMAAAKHLCARNCCHLAQQGPAYAIESSSRTLLYRAILCMCQAVRVLIVGQADVLTVQNSLVETFAGCGESAITRDRAASTGGYHSLCHGW